MRLKKRRRRDIRAGSTPPPPHKKGGGGTKKMNINPSPSHKGIKLEKFLVVVTHKCRNKYTDSDIFIPFHTSVCKWMWRAFFVTNQSQKWILNCVMNLIIVWQSKELGMRLELHVHVGQLPETGPLQRTCHSYFVLSLGQGETYLLLARAALHEFYNARAVSYIQSAVSVLSKWV